MLSAIQGLYYFVTGIWPIVHMAGFLAFTGLKQDLWLVRTVGWLLMVSGIVLMLAALRRRRVPEVVFLAMGNGAVLAGIDTYYALNGQIQGVYLLDAAVEVIFLFFWFRFLWKSWHSTSSRPAPHAGSQGGEP